MKAKKDKELSNVEGEILCSYGPVEIKRVSLNRIFQGNKFFDDDLIDAKLWMFHDNLPIETKNKIYVFNSHFLPKLMKFGFEGVLKWTKMVSNIFDFDYLLFPYNESLHWSLVIISKIKQWAVQVSHRISTQSNEACFIHMDSLGSHNPNKLYSTLSNYLSRLWFYYERFNLLSIGVNINFEVKNKWQKGTIIAASSNGYYTIRTNDSISKDLYYKLDGNDSNFTIDDNTNLYVGLPRVDDPICPKQINWFDCGVYVIYYGKHWFRISPTTTVLDRSRRLGDQLTAHMFSPADITEFRGEYYREILLKYKQKLSK
jgi:Ulp1 family protease